MGGNVLNKLDVEEGTTEPRVIKTLRAEHDLDDIWFHIAMDNQAAADRPLDTFMTRARLMATQPNMGNARPELAVDLRSFSVGQYVIFYNPLPDGIELVRVRHAKRDLSSLEIERDDDT